MYIFCSSVDTFRPTITRYPTYLSPTVLLLLERGAEGADGGPSGATGGTETRAYRRHRAALRSPPREAIGQLADEFA